MRWILLITLSAFLVSILSGQSWHQAGNVIQQGRYDDVFFLNRDMGWTCSLTGRIYRTDDGGEHWDLLFEEFPYSLRSLTFVNEEIGFAGTLHGKLMRTSDGGVSWTEIEHHVPGPMEGICGLDQAGGHVFGVGAWGYPAFFIRSTDLGETWTYQDMSAYADGLVEVQFINHEIGWLGGIRENEGGVVLKTMDGGQTWETVHVTQDPFEYIWKIDLVSDSIFYASIESFDSSTTILKTIDGGDSWFELPVTNEGLDIQGIGFRDSLHGWIGPRSEPILETKDGGYTWEQLTVMPGMNRFFRLDRNLIYASGRGGVFRFDESTTSISKLTSVEKQHALTGLAPNPGNTELCVTFRIDAPTRVRLDLYSVATGRVVPIWNGRLVAGLYPFNIPSHILAELPAGPWLVTLRTNEGFLCQTWIKME